MDFYGLTHQGKVRDNNEDSFAVFNKGFHMLPNLSIVADGMGGHQAGEVASRMAIDFFLEYISGYLGKLDGVMDLLTEAVQYANGKVYEKSISTPEFAGMGTTFTACVVMDGRVFIAHVGDSRLYLLKPNEIRQVTMDHTYVSEMVRAGQITPEEALTHPRRNALTKALGVGEKVEVDGYAPEYDGGLILICSDGLSNMVKNEEILHIAEASDDLESCAKRLVAKANENGGIDNITVILGKSKEVK